MIYVFYHSKKMDNPFNRPETETLSGIWATATGLQAQRSRSSHGDCVLNSGNRRNVEFSRIEESRAKRLQGGLSGC